VQESEQEGALPPGCKDLGKHFTFLTRKSSTLHQPIKFAVKYKIFRPTIDSLIFSGQLKELRNPVFLNI